jgi:hypothetical protein
MQPCVANFCVVFSVLGIQSGGARRDRTADPLRARQVLSQLSYGPTRNNNSTYNSPCR